MKNKIDTLLFDLDGTLTNSKSGIINSIVYALDKLKIHEPNVHELDSFIGPPLKGSFVARYRLSDEGGDKAVQAYREYFSRTGLFENEVYPGISELLAHLHGAHASLYVATSKPTIFATKILEHFDLAKYFKGIVGSNLDNTRTEKAEVIAHTMTVYELNAATSLMIGDRQHDIIGARENALRVVGVTYGFGTVKEIADHAPDFIAHDPTDLGNIIKALL